MSEMYEMLLTFAGLLIGAAAIVALPFVVYADIDGTDLPAGFGFAYLAVWIATPIGAGAGALLGNIIGRDIDRWRTARKQIPSLPK